MWGLAAPPQRVTVAGVEVEAVWPGGAARFSVGVGVGFDLTRADAKNNPPDGA